MLGIAIAMAMATEKPQKIVKIVKIDGISFKVRQRGNKATVSRQAALVNADANHFLMAKQAASYATRCTVTDAFPVFALLNVVLDCTQPQTSIPTGVEIQDNE